MSLTGALSLLIRPGWLTSAPRELPSLPPQHQDAYLKQKCTANVLLIELFPQPHLSWFILNVNFFLPYISK